MKKTNVFINFILVGLIKFFAIFKRQRIIEKTKIKGPAIVLSNHTSFFDFAYTAAALYPKRVNYMVAKKFFYEKPLGNILRLANAIPKALLDADAYATKLALKVLYNNGILSMFPEGQISTTGVFMGFGLSLAKLIKKVEVPVYGVKHHNAYLVNPPWTKKTYRGKIDTRKFLIASKEDIKNLSVTEIYNLIIENLKHNPFEYNKIKKYKYRIKSLNGLENILYECPFCKEETLIIENHDLVCTNCLTRNHLDKYWQLEKLSIHEYYESQRESIIEKLNNGIELSLKDEVKLETICDGKIVEVGSGIFELSENGYFYKGNINEEEVDLKFEIKNVSSMPSDIGKNVQIYSSGQLYQFVFDNPKRPIKYVLLGEVLHKINLQ